MSKYDTSIEFILAQFLNIPFIFITLEVLNLSISVCILVNSTHESNICAISITFNVLNTDIFKD